MTVNYKTITHLLCKNGDVRCLLDEPLSKHTSFGVGGDAKLYIYPATCQALSTALQVCNEIDIVTFVIGYGTNLLVSDDGFNGCVIDLSDCCSELSVNGDIITAGSAVHLDRTVRFAANAGLGGNWDKLAGVHGGIGGGLRMNAGAFRAFISDHLIDVDVMEPDGIIHTMEKDELDFQYRDAPGLKGKIVLKARFQLPRRPVKEALEAIEATVAERRRRNVDILPSAGSIFKNLPGHYTAKLIESVGGKGMRVGGVRVSPDHANIIINDQGGSANDIVELIEQVRKLVKDRYDLDLSLELKMIGFGER